MREALPYLFGTDLQWQQRYCQIKSLKYLFPCLDDNVNFPFSNTSPAIKGQILGSLPSDDVVDTLVNNYLGSFGATHCLFHPAQLRYEVQQFYNARSEVSDEWLAQLCMILALGAESLPDSLFSGSGQSSTEWSNIFLNAAQASFGRSSYMVAPTLCTVRTLCMMLLAKLVEAQASGGSTSGNNGDIGRDSATRENLCFYTAQRRLGYKRFAGQITQTRASLQQQTVSKQKRSVGYGSRSSFLTSRQLSEPV
ncbi:hypothetical protein HMPREF1624_08022 [Sporothrix schenckii ATCC 58251]|uniref:Transcription factor domain-containing protein n=1 Tax=Sporothrix schenckii (strain ATCC 58251 / de Perez 2211183) TaxID=1391915 RepID=U7PKS1_SPOS1|nr:hypothetical protein HMPREF1624_08022 [Sporothrix schenckii ATCC 58251]